VGESTEGGGSQEIKQLLTERSLCLRGMGTGKKRNAKANYMVKKGQGALGLVKGHPAKKKIKERRDALLREEGPVKGVGRNPNGGRGAENST